MLARKNCKELLLPSDASPDAGVLHGTHTPARSARVAMVMLPAAYTLGVRDQAGRSG